MSIGFSSTGISRSPVALVPNFFIPLGTATRGVSFPPFLDFLNLTIAAIVKLISAVRVASIKVDADR